MKPSALLRKNLSQIRDIFKNYPMITNPRIFGSVARGDDDDDSDIDIVVDILPGTSLFTIGGLQYELEALFPNKKIDLIHSQNFSQAVLEEINIEGKNL